MGIIINLSEARARLNNENDSLRTTISNLNSLKNRIQDFIDDNILISEAYESTRDYYRSIHIPIIVGFICYAQAKIEDNETYKRALNTLYSNSIIKEDDVRNSLTQTNKLIAELEGKQFSESYLRVLEMTKQELERKLDDIRYYTHATTSIYGNSSALLEKVTIGVNVMSNVAYDSSTNTFNFSSLDMSWSKELLDLWQNNSLNQYTVTQQLCREFYNSLPDNIKPYISLQDIYATDDGFVTCTKSLADILKAMGRDKVAIVEKDKNNMERINLLDVDLYYDDWYLYAIKGKEEFVYSIFKMREQEYDKGDSDASSVTIPFIKANIDELFNYKDENDPAFANEVNRLTQRKEVPYDSTLKDYFKKAQSKAGYLIADLYTNKILSLYPEGTITTVGLQKRTAELDIWLKKMDYNYDVEPETVLSIIQQEIKRLERIPKALLNINQEAGYEIYNHETSEIKINDVNNPTHLERQAILAIHTGNVSYNSFVAEIEFHAIALDDIKAIFPTWYNSGLRSDMGLDEENESGRYDKYYNLEDESVKNQEKIHGKQ